jgi:hypothetical protein
MLIFAKAVTQYLLFYEVGKQSGYPYPLFREAGMKIILLQCLQRGAYPLLYKVGLQSGYGYLLFYKAG